VIEWLTMARIVRGAGAFVEIAGIRRPARSLGQSQAKIILLHLLPNITGIIVVYSRLRSGVIITNRSQFPRPRPAEPQVSWGCSLADGAQVINPIRSYWWLLVFPAATMCVTCSR